MSDGGDLSVKIAEHGVRKPATGQANHVGVNISVEEGGGARGAQALGLNLGEVVVRIKTRSGKA